MSTSTAPVLTFLGGAGTVTGSKTLLDVPKGRVLVDCGLFQGTKALRLQNWAPFPVAPGDIRAVVLTHAHLDHCGYIPRLTRLGFTGPIYCTEGTRSLAEIILPDSGHLQEEEARFANRKGYSKHDPAEPLYTKEDAMDSLRQFQAVPTGRSLEILDGLVASFHRVGHILGAASIRLDLKQEDLVLRFSGDMGRATHPLLMPPEPIGRADIVVIESTYGDEQHRTTDPEAQLAEAVEYVLESGGALVVPAFAVDRTEVVLWHLDRLIASGRIPSIPVFVDSPMASRALDVYRDSARRGDPELRPDLHGTRLFPSLDLTEVATVEESKDLNDRRGPMVIVSASGMATGGRVLHHLVHRIGDESNAVMLVGFQAPGTRGDALAQGAGRLKMFGQYHAVRARVFSVELSAHADQDELIDWLATAAPPPEMVFVNHGEATSSEILAQAIETRLGIDAVVPRPGERVRVDPRPGGRSGRRGA